MKTLIGAVMAVVLTCGVVTASAKPKIGMAKASRIASKQVLGTITSKELEKEKGRWIYSFDIRTGKGKITEVTVDAYSGKIVSVEHESAKSEAKEAKDEKKEKH